MKRGAIVQYYVEGDDEKKLIEVLKAHSMILPGKVHVFNTVSERVSNARLMTLKQGTNVVLIFDTDVEKRDILNENIRLFRECSNVSAVYTIPQNKNLEDEIVRSCDIKDVRDFFGNKSVKAFKSSFIKEKDLKKKLDEKKFDLQKMWSVKPDNKFKDLGNDSEVIKL